jgi:hypothetical protein
MQLYKNDQLARPSSLRVADCFWHSVHLTEFSAHFALATFHCSVVQVSTSLAEAETVDGCAEGAGVCAKAAPQAAMAAAAKAAATIKVRVLFMTEFSGFSATLPDAERFRECV